MKKKIMSILTASAMTASVLAAAPSVTALADGTMVVSIGADLTEDQKTAILKYFGIYGNSSVQTITVTNTDERNHLASYIPIEQIGSHTISCALVKPTTSGGIQVKTANLDYITSNMIASNLATVGVTNCQAIAAAPFEVSGTGALTGILMAYENATGTTITQQAKNLSAQEISVTQDITNSVENQQVAQQIVNDVKMQIVEGNVTTDNSVDNSAVTEIVNNVVNNYTTNNTTNTTVSLSDADIQSLTDLANQIAQQSYDQGTADALAQIQASLEEQTGIQSSDATQQAVDEAAAQETEEAENTPESETDSIFAGTDIAQLNNGDTSSTLVTGTDEAVISNDTAEGAQNNDANISSEAQSETNAETAGQSDDSGIVITTQESGSFGGDTVSETAAETASTETTAPETAAETGSSELPADSSVQPAQTEAVSEAPAAGSASVTITADNIDQYSTSFLNEDDTAAYVPSFALALAQDNLVPVSGTFTVSDSNGNVLGTADLSDSSAVTAVTSGSIVETFKMNHGWNQFTGLFFEAKGEDGSVVVPSDGTYTVTLNGTFAQTADPTQTEGAPVVAIDLENVQLTYAAPSGFAAQSSLSSLLAGMDGAGTVIFPEDGSAAFAVVSAADGDDTMVSTPAGDGSVTPDSPEVSTTFASAGLKQINISFYATAEDYAAQAAPVSTMSYFIPVKA